MDNIIFNEQASFEYPVPRTAVFTLESYVPSKDKLRIGKNAFALSEETLMSSPVDYTKTLNIPEIELARAVQYLAETRQPRTNGIAVDPTVDFEL